MVAAHSSLENLTARLNALGVQKDQCTGLLRAQIAALTLEAEVKEAPIEAEIAKIRLQMEAIMRDAGIPQLKTMRFTFSLAQKTTWDSKGLEIFALERPEILQFRQETPYTQLRWK